MSIDELRAAAIKCLEKAFRGDDVPPHVVAAAVSVLMMPEGLRQP